MKITGINIGEYRQFKNINFDFTYPADYHDETKRGKPLDKVCFIGQSGTGKTTLLNVIWDFIENLTLNVAAQNTLDINFHSNSLAVNKHRLYSISINDDYEEIGRAHV